MRTPLLTAWLVLALRWLLVGIAPAAMAQSDARPEGEGVFVRFKLTEPRDATWHVRLGGFIHVLLILAIIMIAVRLIQGRGV